MAQWSKYKEGEYKYWTDPVSGLKIRYGQLAGVFRCDFELEVGGFALAEDVGWTNDSTHQGLLSGTSREGALSTNYVLQKGTDFNGVEGVGFETLITA
jgi:hypothetical protein